MRKTLLFFLFSLFITVSFGQTTIQGTIIDKSNREPLPGATIVIKGTTKGTVSGVDGTFLLKDVPGGRSILVITFIGYQSREIEVKPGNEPVKLGEVELEADAIGLNEISVLANIAIERKTPIAVTNIKLEQIEEKLGTQEFPEILKSSPGVYATKRGGGFGDASVRIRGFGSSNVAVMINGMPVNGMEDDKVYWSNWAGLSDVTRNMQVQRGIGASKIAVPSVGGTINVITKTTDSKKGGSIFYNMGNDNFNKAGITLSSGLTEKNWAFSISLSKTSGDGYVEGTPFEGYSYFLSLSKKINKKHQMALTVFGAPQQHAQRYKHQQLSILKTRKDGQKYNADWGYLNGQFYSNSTNFYHKPVAILNHYFDIDKNTFLSSSVYASVGIGGGGYATENSVKLTQNEQGQINWDKAMADNILYASKGQGGGLFYQNSYNYHRWYGALSSLKKTIGPLEILAGIDLRYYYGEHWQQADDLFGASFVYDKRNRDAVNFYNNAVKTGDKIYYDNDGEVAWEGLFLQGEYSEDKLTAFASVSVSNRSYRRYDFSQYFSDDLKEELKNDAGLAEQWENKLQDYMLAHNYSSIYESEAYKVNQVSVWRNFFGFSFKTGANYNLNENHNVFINGGYMERQPIFSTVFQNYKNLINPSAVNEKVASAEVGYGYRSSTLSANVNAYYTLWKDKTETGNILDVTSDDPDDRLFFNIEGVNARHMGLEMDFVYQPIKALNINGMISLGDWIWNNNVDTVKIYKDQVMVGKYDALYIKGIHVADAAQSSASVGISYDIFKGLKVGTELLYFDRIYSDFDLDTRDRPSNENTDAERLPSYFLMDVNMVYYFSLGGFDATIFGNINNALNSMYIADGVEGEGYYFGFGRTMSLGLKIKF